MRSRYSKWAAAAVLIVAGLGVVLLDRSATPAYAIEDLPKAFAQAQVVHVQGRLYFPGQHTRDGQGMPPAPIASWIDLENRRTRHSGASLGRDAAGNLTIATQEVITDGPCQMQINHSDRSVTFSRMSDYQQKLNTYQTSEFVAVQLFGQIRQMADSVMVGHEQKDGVPYDIWQSDVTAPFAARYKHWLSARDGRLARVQALQQTPAGTWELKFEFSTVEYDVPIPEETFALVPPKGYTTTNSKDTAAPIELGRGPGFGYTNEHYSLQCGPVISFTLSNGSVVLGWRSLDRKSAQPLDRFFEDLTLGGPLPKLPVEIYGLIPAGEPNAVTYIGCHLAYTCKGKQWTEWSLYVPDGAPAPHARTLGYCGLYRFNVDPTPQWSMQMYIEYGIPIEAAEGFDNWVRGAMAELNDSGVAPERVTYEKVMELARQNRSSSTR